MAFSLAACDNEDPKPAFPEISVNNGEVSLGYEGKTTPITVTSNRDFEIENDVDWLAFDYDPESEEISNYEAIKPEQVEQGVDAQFAKNDGIIMFES